MSPSVVAMVIAGLNLGIVLVLLVRHRRLERRLRRLER